MLEIPKGALQKAQEAELRSAGFQFALAADGLAADDALYQASYPADSWNALRDRCGIRMRRRCFHDTFPRLSLSPGGVACLGNRWLDCRFGHRYGGG